MNSLLISRILLLVLGLVALYRIGVSDHLLKKILAWAVFQSSIVLLWLSSSYRYHDHLNPLPQVAAFLIGIFSIGILGIMLVFAWGVFRRFDLSEMEKTNSERKT